MLASGVFVLYSPEYAHYAILLISLVLISYGIKSLLPYYEAKKWVKGTATICSLKETYEMIKESEYSQLEYYYPLVEYTYRYKGIEHTNDCVTFEKQNIWTSGYNSWGGKLPEKHKPWHAWSTDNSIVVYINPKSPQQSVLLPLLTKSRKSHHLAIIASGVLIFIIWVLLMYNNMKIR